MNTPNLSINRFFIFCCIFFFIAISITNAQLTFEPTDIISKHLIPDGVRDLAAGDINNDGYIDFVSADLNKRRILWHNNIKGTGEFVNAILISESIRPSEVLLDDADEDGDLDLFVLATYQDSIFWFENLDGLGDFGQKQFISSSPEAPTSLNIVDLDNDGHKDLLFTDNEGDIYIYRKNGSAGIYDPAIVMDNNFFDGAFLTTSDIDGDNNMDLLLSDLRDDEVYWIKNMGDLSFGPMTLIDDQLRGPTIIHTSDLDNDGDQDVIVYGKHDYTLSWYENLDGSGNFGQSILINAEVITGYDIETADINQDGFVEIVISATGRDKVSIFSRTDTQQAFEEIVLSDDLRFARSISLKDVDEDNDLDIIACSSNDVQIQWFDNLLMDWDFERKSMISKLLEEPSEMEFYDVDKDGDKDILTSSQKLTELTSSILWYENVGDGNFLTEKELLFEDELRLRKIKAVDLDQDGDVDILATSEEKLVWYKNNEITGEFEEILITSEFGSDIVEVLDYDLDGDLDVVATLGQNSYQTRKLWIFNNLDGLGTLDQGQELTTASDFSYYTDLKVLDFDNDGDEDLIVGEYNGSIFLFEVAMGLEFTSNLLLETDYGLVEYETSDIDLDGDLDFTCIYQNKDKLELYKDIEGDQSSYEQILIDDEIEDAVSVELGDIDSDGDIDILTTSFNNDTIFLYENANADGVFFPRQAIHINDSGLKDIKLIDIDRNGSLDPFVLNNGLGRITLLLNNGQSSSAILGLVKLDVQNNECSMGAIPLEGIQISTESEVEIESFYTLQNGFYRIFVGEGDFLTSISQSDIDYYSPLIDTVASNFSIDITVDTVNFCLVKNGEFYDLRLSIIPIDQTRPGFRSNYEVIAKNIGTEPLGGEICIIVDSTKMQFVSSPDSVILQNGDSLVLHLDTISNYESSSLFVEYQVNIPQLLNLDEPICIEGIIKSDTIDSNLENNYFKLNDILVNSFDPNDIMVLEGKEVLFENAQDYLHYVIRFQNTGTAEAINVRLENEIEDKLDYTSLEILSSSHNVRSSISEGSLATFEFAGIYLPDSNANEALSHGYLSYRIKPLPGRQVGEVFENNADIFFDFNDPVRTNTVSTKIVEFTSVVIPEEIKLNIYPVPATDNITINLPSDFQNVIIYNANGVPVLSGKTNTFYVGNLPSGLYYSLALLKNGQKVNGVFVKI